MNKHQQTRHDLLKHLDEQVEFLRASCDRFDIGHYEEAKRLAHTIRTLLHDTKVSKSLLGQLGAKQKIGYLNTSPPYDPTNLFPHIGLMSIQIEGNNVYFLPKLERALQNGKRRYSFFQKWWNDPVLVDKGRLSFNRRELILAVANQDGGSHVDPVLEKSYALLSRGHGMKIMKSDGVFSFPIMEAELHSARQIAFELLESLDRHFKWGEFSPENVASQETPRK